MRLSGNMLKRKMFRDIKNNLSQLKFKENKDIFMLTCGV